jgi:hypothetical protein
MCALSLSYMHACIHVNILAQNARAGTRSPRRYYQATANGPHDKQTREEKKRETNQVFALLRFILLPNQKNAP